MKTMILGLLLLICFTGNAYCQPAGTIIAYAGTKESITPLLAQGWVICDGAQYDRRNVKFAALFGAIGSSWGGDAGNLFAVPDLQGVFLRGVSAGSGVDPNADTRTASRPDLHSAGNSGNAVGSKQADENKSHAHTATINGGTFPTTAPGMGIQSNSGQQVQFVGLSVNVATNGGAESRPKNAYVYYLIKL